MTTRSRRASRRASDSAGSKHDGDLEIVTQQGNEEDELVPIRDSDIQLMEQTEREDSAVVAMGRLNIRTFKILVILREKEKDKGIRDANSTEPVSTVSF